MATVRKSYMILVALVAIAGGCSGPYAARKEVSGTVKLGGQPIQKGIIDFSPLDGQETKSGALIENGEYKIPQKSGLVPGKYLVRIEDGDGVTTTVPEDIAGPSKTNIVSKDRVPPDWGVNTKQQVTVTEKGPNKFDYDIPTK